MASLTILSGLVATVSLSLCCLAWDPDFNILVIVPSAKRKSPSNGEILVMESVRQLRLPFRLRITELPMDCDPSELSRVQLVQELTAVTKERMTVAVIGLFCKKIATQLNGIANQERLGILRIALDTFLPVMKGDEALYHIMLPSTLTYAEALAQFMVHGMDSNCNCICYRSKQLLF